VHKNTVTAVALSKFFGILVAVDVDGNCSVSRLETGRTFIYRNIETVVKKIMCTKNGFLIFIAQNSVQVRDMRLMLLDECQIALDSCCLMEMPEDRRFLAIASGVTVSVWKFCPFHIKKSVEVPYRPKDLIYLEAAKKLLCILGSEDQKGRMVIASDMLL
jgi:hypothetical protein